MTFMRFSRPKAKFGNRTSVCTINGVQYQCASALEASVGTIIEARRQAGELYFIKQQDRLLLGPGQYIYIADFKCKGASDGMDFWVEAKGEACKRGRWPSTVKQWKAFGPGRLEVWVGTWQRPYLEKTIVPEPDQTLCRLCQAALTPDAK